MYDRAKRIIDHYIRPLVEADGGRIDLLEVEEGKVVVRLSGTCAGCPGQPYTLERIIEPALRHGLGTDIHVQARNS